jgi:hypothetical protein
MSDWHHKAADELASAVANHIKYVRDDLANTAQLIGIYKAAKRAATVTETGPEELIHIRVILCYACRQNKSYPCDLDASWSPNCAFVRANSEPQTA